ncbi:hypothetical protein A3709_19500 [Halioglobus sp. HI00S01]|nr:hypothetical protein A3709_19500 [Halioglobus sp. HI00S01]
MGDQAPALAVCLAMQLHRSEVIAGVESYLATGSLTLHSRLDDTGMAICMASRYHCQATVGILQPDQGSDFIAYSEVVLL